MGEKHTTITLVLMILSISLIAPCASSSVIQERYEILENGNVLVSLYVQDYTPDTFDLPDEINPDAMTVQESSDTNDTILSYTTSYLTRKDRGIWYFESYNRTSERVVVRFPEHVQIVRSQPPASIQSDPELQFYWTNTTSSVSVSFVFTDTQARSANQREQEPARYDNLALLLAGFSGAILISIIGLIILTRTKQKRDGSRPATTTARPDEQPGKRPDITEAQMNIIRTANPNASKIITLLLRHNNHMKRTELEKESGLAKSSLASTLNSLEKKGIISIDRSFHVHHIKFSDWFQTL